MPYVLQSDGSTSNLGRIWEPFVQADTSLERRRSGLGLALTLARSLVDLRGGSISGRSDGVGRGSDRSAEVIRHMLHHARGAGQSRR
jgi:signal transduction histidine kinase